MNLKSYFAKDIKAALGMARQELGPDAMLVHSRKTPTEARHLGEWEGVFATEPMGGGQEGGAAGAAPDAPGRLSGEVAELRKQLARMAAAVARSNLLASVRALPSAELAEVFAAMVEAEVDPELAHDILNRFRASGVVFEPSQLSRALEAELAGRFAVDPQLGRGGDRRVVALVGPCGSGKTTTLVKLAVLYGLSARRPTQLLSLDSYRIAAAEQLRSYAAILGVGFQALETPAALAQALEEHRHKDLVLIDTPGHSLRDMDAAADLARFLAGRPDIDTHLVLTASMKSADLSRVVDRFEIFRPRKLLFTKLDETEACGPILSEAARTAKPLSFLSTGQQIPEDLEPATKGRIIDLVLRRKAADGGAQSRAVAGAR